MMINPNICFAFNKTRENCFFTLDQNYNCVLGWRNVTIKNCPFIVENRSVFLWHRVSLMSADKWWKGRMFLISRTRERRSGILNQSSDQDYDGEEMAGAPQPNTCPKQTARGPLPKATEDRKWWHPSTSRKADILKAQRKRLMMHFVSL